MAAVRAAVPRHAPAWALTASLLVAACGPRAVPAPSSSRTPVPEASGVVNSASSRSTVTERVAVAAADSLRGVVERAGSEPQAQLRLRTADARRCELSGAVPTSAEGVEITAWGRDAARPGAGNVPCAFVAISYAVRAVDGVAATDGVLREERGVLHLVGAAGRTTPLPYAPATLRAMIGARVYWAGPLDRPPQAYGVLVAPTPR